MNEKAELLRMIPSVDRILSSEKVGGALEHHPRSLVLKAIQEVLGDLRGKILVGEITEPDCLAYGSVVSGVLRSLEALVRPSLRPVVNATGVVVHTNLGRSLLAERVIERLREIGGAYSNLEYDLAKGKRGSRYVHVEEILREQTGAEAAMVVNNNAAAVLLALDTLARGKEVVVSRGQLVEIGGSFRIPEVMKRSGALMVEVGTTNKTHLRDYISAIGPETALLLKVHTSNYQIVGFTAQVPLTDLVALGRERGIPVMEDLGSGCLLDLGFEARFREPTVKEVLADGADLVTFSGDKLLGGPQAGIILGKRPLVEAIRGNQMTRALRIDKLTLLALEETLRIYRDASLARKEIPTLRMLSSTHEALCQKADRLRDMTKGLPPRNFTVELLDGASRVGGGAMPLLELPTRLLGLVPGRLSSHAMEVWLRGYDPPIVARLEKDRVLLDVRTLREEDIQTVVRALRDLASVEEA